MLKHSGPPAAVIYMFYMLGQNWFTCRASRGVANTPYPHHRYHSGANADRYEYRPCEGAGSGYPAYPWSDHSCNPTWCRRSCSHQLRVPRQPTTHAPVAGHWLPVGSPSSSATGHHPHGNEPCSARSRTRGSCPNAGKRNSLRFHADALEGRW